MYSVLYERFFLKGRFWFGFVSASALFLVFHLKHTGHILPLLPDFRITSFSGYLVSLLKVKCPLCNFPEKVNTYLLMSVSKLYLNDQ